MYIPLIKDKHSLVDLAKYGSKPRKSIHPNLLIGNYPEECPLFKEGDILDGNATFNLIQCAYDQDRVYKELSAKIAELEEKYDVDTGDVKTALLEIENDITECSSNLLYVEDKHDRDIQQIRQDIDSKFNEISILNRFVYDDLEELLFIIK